MAVIDQQQEEIKKMTQQWYDGEITQSEIEQMKEESDNEKTFDISDVLSEVLDTINSI